MTTISSHPTPNPGTSSYSSYFVPATPPATVPVPVPVVSCCTDTDQAETMRGGPGMRRGGGGGGGYGRSGNAGGGRPQEPANHGGKIPFDLTFFDDVFPRVFPTQQDDTDLTGVRISLSNRTQRKGINN